MIRRLSSTLYSLGRACSDFGSYFMSIQRRCFKTGLREDCEGGPSTDEARNDHLAMRRTRGSDYYAGPIG